MPESPALVAAAQVKPKGVFEAAPQGGPTRLSSPSPIGGSPPNTQRAPLEPSNFVGGPQSVGTMSPDGGSPPSDSKPALEASKGQGGPQIIGRIAPESGDGQGS